MVRAFKNEQVEQLIKERDVYREVAIKIDHDWTERDGYDWPKYAVDVDAEAQRILKEAEEKKS